MNSREKFSSRLGFLLISVPSDWETYGAFLILQDSTEELPLSLFI